MPCTSIDATPVACWGPAAADSHILSVENQVSQPSDTNPICLSSFLMPHAFQLALLHPMRERRG